MQDNHEFLKNITAIIDFISFYIVEGLALYASILSYLLLDQYIVN